MSARPPAGSDGSSCSGEPTVDELVAATGWPVASVLAALTLLERRGLAVGVHGRFRPAGGLVLADPATPATPAARERMTRGPLAPPVCRRDRRDATLRQVDLPRWRPAPPRCDLPEHEQERLLRKAAAALLAVPILALRLRRCAAATLDARSGQPRVRPGLILGIGVVAVGRPASTVATPPTAIVPLTRGGFTTAVATNRASRGRYRSIQRADGSTGRWRPRSRSSRPRDVVQLDASRRS